MNQPIDGLNEREREALRRVASGYNTKQIAAQLKVSPARAGKIIHAANQKLGVSNRMDAARLLAKHEGRGVNVIPGAMDTLPPTLDLPATNSQDEGRRVPSLREERLAYGAGDTTADLGLPLRERGGRGNDLTAAQRVTWIVALAAVALLGVGTLAFGLGSLSEQIILVPSQGR